MIISFSLRDVGIPNGTLAPAPTTNTVVVIQSPSQEIDRYGSTPSIFYRAGGAPGEGFIVRDLPWTIDKLRAIPPFEFENRGGWAVIALGGVPNKVQVGDMGIDGRLFPPGSKPSDADGMFAGDWFPIQVKQSEKVGRPDVDSFEAVMHREDRAKGFVVAFSYTSDAVAEANAFQKKTKRQIKLFTVEEILDEQHLQKM